MIIRNIFSLVLYFALSLTVGLAPCVHAQLSQSSARELLNTQPNVDLPMGFNGSSEGTTGSRLARPSATRTITPIPGAQIIEKPGMQQTGGLKLSTQIETRVENRFVGDGEKKVDRPAAPANPPPKSLVHFEFENFVEQSLGAPLTLYGEQVFNSPTPAYLAPEQSPLPPDYILGPGDEIATRAWGQIDIDHVGNIDRSGQLYLPRIGPISLTGIRYADLPAVLKQAISKQFKNFELSVLVGANRPITIHITGAAKKPGSIIVPAYSTFLSAIFQAGGAGEKANFRRLQLRRNGITISELDLYALLSDGDNRADRPLRNGDILHFPVTEGTVAMAGSVNLPGYFQLRRGDSLGGLLKLAGGPTATANIEYITLERISQTNPQQRQRTVERVKFDRIGLSRIVNDGDLYIFTPISPRIENVVTINGNVAMPIRSAYFQGMRISDLIPNTDALIKPTYWTDKNNAQTLRSIGETRVTEIKKDFPEINWEYAAIERIDRQSLTSKIIPFNLRLAIEAKDPAHNLELQSGDTVTIFAKSDLRIPLSQRTRYVRIEGEVRQVGTFSLNANATTLRQVIARAGGLTAEAFPYGIQVQRESVRMHQQARMNETLDKLESDFHRYFAARARNAVSTEEAQSTPFEIENLKALITKMRAIKATGRIVLDFDLYPVYEENLPDMILEDGDVIYIPSTPMTISVVGAVMNEGTFLFRDAKTLGDYLRQAGGAARYADEARLHILRADGSMIGAQPSWWGVKGIDRNFVLRPGDTIIQPENPERVSTLRWLKDWTQVFYQFGLGAAGVAILKGL